MEKVKIKDTFLHNLDVEGYVDVVIGRLKSIKLDAEGKGWTDIQVEERWEWENHSINIIGIRDETDKEKKQRLTQEMVDREHRRKKLTRKKKRTEQEDRELYELLKEKFGN